MTELKLHKVKENKINLKGTEEYVKERVLKSSITIPKRDNAKKTFQYGRNQ